MGLKKKLLDLYWYFKDIKIVRNLNTNPDCRFIYLPKSVEKTFVDIYIKAGAITEGKEQAGIGHLLEHYISGLVNKKLGSGSEFGAKINDNYIVFYLELDNDVRFVDIIDRFFDIVFKPGFDDQEVFDSEKQSIISELERERNETKLKLERLVEKTRYNDEPNQRSFVDHLSKLKALTIDDISAYHHKIFTKENLKVLLSSSSFEPRLKRLFADKLSQVNLTEGLSNYPAPEYSNFTLKVVEDPDISGNYAVMTFPSINRAVNLREKITLSMMVSLLRDKEVQQKIRESGIYNLEISYTQGVNNGYFVMKSYLTKGQIVSWIKIVCGLIRKSKNGEIGHTHFGQVKDRWIHTNLEYWRSNRGRFDIVSDLIFSQEEILSRQEIYTLIKSVNEDDIREMFRKIFNKEKMNLVIYGELIELQPKELEEMLTF